MTLFHISVQYNAVRVDWGVNSKGVAGSEVHWDVLFVENICDFRFTTGQDPTVHVHQKHEGHSFSDASVHMIVMVS